MPLPNVSDLTQQELLELIARAQAAYRAGEAAEFDEIERRRQAIANAATTLATVLGPAGAEPSTTSIRGVLAYPDEIISQHSALAHRLMLQGLEAVTASVLDLAHVVAAQNR